MCSVSQRALQSLINLLKLVTVSSLSAVRYDATADNYSSKICRMAHCMLRRDSTNGTYTASLGSRSRPFGTSTNSLAWTCQYCQWLCHRTPDAVLYHVSCISHWMIHAHVAAHDCSSCLGPSLIIPPPATPTTHL